MSFWNNKKMNFCPRLYVLKNNQPVSFHLLLARNLPFSNFAENTPLHWPKYNTRLIRRYGDIMHSYDCRTRNQQPTEGGCSSVQVVVQIFPRIIRSPNENLRLANNQGISFTTNRSHRSTVPILA